MYRKSIVVCIALLSFFAATAAMHFAMQNAAVYEVATYPSRLLHFHHSIHETNSAGEYAYESITDEHLLRWDAVHYSEISKHFYDTTQEWAGDYAFFPLFPALWRATAASATAISLINILLFCLGAGLLLLCFKNIEPWTIVLPLCLPCMTPYAIPYSESLFFITAAIGMVGYIKERYWLFFVGFMLASTTRAAGTLMIAAWIAADLLTALYNRERWTTALRDLALHTAPVITGVALVMVFQHLRGAEHWMQFALAQSEWGKALSWPSLPLSDWSEEGKSMAWTLMIVFFPLSVTYIVWQFVGGLQASARPADPPRLSDRHATLRLFCVLLFAGNICLALLTQHGCMYSMTRLLTCTPFFCFLVIDCANNSHAAWLRWVVAGLMVIAAIVMHQAFNHATMQGIWIALSLTALMFWPKDKATPYRNLLLTATIVGNMAWNAYLMDCYLKDSWIFL